MHEPFHRVAYRFGRPGHIELEQVATPTRRFGLWKLSEPHSFENVIGFSVGAMRYDITFMTIMGRGVFVYVAHGHRHTEMLVSGDNFRLGPASIDFDRSRPASPVFEWRYPTELRSGAVWRAKDVGKSNVRETSPAASSAN